MTTRAVVAIAAMVLGVAAPLGAAVGGTVEFRDSETATFIAVSGPSEASAGRVAEFVFRITAEPGNSFGPINLIGAGALAFALPESVDVDHANVRMRIQPFGSSEWEPFDWRARESIEGRGTAAVLRWLLGRGIWTIAGGDGSATTAQGKKLFPALSDQYSEIVSSLTDLNRYDVMVVDWDWSPYRWAIGNYRSEGQATVEVTVPVRFTEDLTGAAPIAAFVTFEVRPRTRGGVSYTQYNAHGWADMLGALGRTSSTQRIFKTLSREMDDAILNGVGKEAVDAMRAFELAAGNRDTKAVRELMGAEAGVRYGEVVDSLTHDDPRKFYNLDILGIAEGDTSANIYVQVFERKFGSSSQNYVNHVRISLEKSSDGKWLIKNRSYYPRYPFGEARRLSKEDYYDLLALADKFFSAVLERNSDALKAALSPNTIRRQTNGLDRIFEEFGGDIDHIYDPDYKTYVYVTDAFKARRKHTYKLIFDVISVTPDGDAKLELDGGVLTARFVNGKLLVGAD